MEISPEIERGTEASAGRSHRVTGVSSPQPSTLGFGPHLLYDGYGVTPSRLGDIEALYGLLERIPGRIGMTRIMPPYVFRHRSAQGDEGVSGFVLIAESHVSIHTFPNRRYVNADIFSCETFDVETALTELRNAFRPRRVDWKLLDRGREFPKHVAATRAMIERERRWIARGLGLEVPR